MSGFILIDVPALYFGLIALVLVAVFAIIFGLHVFSWVFSFLWVLPRSFWRFYNDFFTYS
jgi:hypothetical protein